jgi:IS30 family transposase
MQTGTTYRQLQPEERMTIASMRLARSGVRAAARALGRSPATISSELSRNADAEGAYTIRPAQALSQTRRVDARGAPKLHPDHVLCSTVLTVLDWKWSQQQIAGILKRVWPKDPTMHISHETIYMAI